jgi:hypothetical protein
MTIELNVSILEEPTPICIYPIAYYRSRNLGENKIIFPDTDYELIQNKFIIHLSSDTINRYLMYPHNRLWLALRRLFYVAKQTINYQPPVLSALPLFLSIWKSKCVSPFVGIKMFTYPICVKGFPVIDTNMCVDHTPLVPSQFYLNGKVTSWLTNEGMDEFDSIRDYYHKWVEDCSRDNLSIAFLVAIDNFES